MLMLTHERVRQVLDYDPQTGHLTWRVSHPYADKGSRAGSFSKKYREIRVDGHRLMEHRVVWFWVHGKWPPSLVDHIDMDGHNNKLSNLRLATHSTNKANRRAPANNSTGFKGVSFNKAAQRFQASICRQYKQMHLGFFATAEEAHAAYRSAAKRLFGDFSRA